MANKSVRTLITVVMDLLIIVALALVARLVVVFFDQLATADIGKAIASLTAPLVLPLGIEPIETPYGGVFDVNALVTLLGLLAVEWVLSLLRKD